MRYFIEVSYLGTDYAGFQTQANAPTIQGTVEKALATFYRRPVQLTGSSRTDTGVHARSNFFHTDGAENEFLEKHRYGLNSLLPKSIAVKSIRTVQPDAHCRFHALSRHYQYFLHREKNPFYEAGSWFYPYPLDEKTLQECAAYLLTVEDFTSFSKRNTQTRTKICHLTKSEWKQVNGQWIYEVAGNRFLRGMVRGLTGTMLQAGRGKIDFEAFRGIIEARDCTLADFSPPGKGLTLYEVKFPETIFLS